MLPRSPLPALDGTGEINAASAPTMAAWKRWVLPGAAVGILLLGVIAVLALYLGRNGGPKPAAPPEGPAAVAVHLRLGREALDQGKLRLAAAEFVTADELRARYPDSLGAADRKQLRQLRRETALLCDLLPESLDHVLSHAANCLEIDEKEWQEEFTARYKGKAVLFDDEVRQEGGGLYRFPYLMTYRFSVRGRPAQLSLGDLQILQNLPLDRPQRLLVGGRIASIGVEPGGNWMVHLVPDSGVLLTDPAAVRAAYPIPADEIREVLERQAKWVADAP